MTAPLFIDLSKLRAYDSNLHRVITNQTKTDPADDGVLPLDKVNTRKLPFETAQKLAQYMGLQETLPDLVAEESLRAGYARIDEYVATENLQDNTANGSAILGYIRDHKLAVSVFSVEQAVEVLRAELAWKAKPVVPPPSVAPTPAAPAAPPPPAEVLKTLADGTVSLPLGTRPTKHHSVLQLRDLDAKERASRPRPSAWHSTTF
jgi:hypothetical protein